MNDFTKDELSMAADGIVLIKKQCKMDDATRDKLDKLDEKLCLMINNYCEHNGEIGKDYPAEKCMDCGSMWE